MKRFCFLVSGGGGPLRFFFYAISLLELPFEIVFVIGDRACGALDFAKAKGIKWRQVQYSRNNGNELISLLQDVKCDYVITNFNKILGADVLSSVKARFVNVHPSLLPAYAGMIGMKTVDCAQSDNNMIIGSTCHDVIEEVDAGRILQQVAFCADWNKEVYRMYDRTFRAACLALLNVFIEDGSPCANGIAGFLFNPPCRFDISRLDECFWQKIKSGE